LEQWCEMGSWSFWLSSAVTPISIWKTRAACAWSDAFFSGDSQVRCAGPESGPSSFMTSPECPQERYDLEQWWHDPAVISKLGVQNPDSEKLTLNREVAVQGLGWTVERSGRISFFVNA